MKYVNTKLFSCCCQKGCQLQKWAWKSIILSIFPPKTAWKWKKLDREGGRASLAPPLWVRQCYMSPLVIVCFLMCERNCRTSDQHGHDLVWRGRDSCGFIHKRTECHLQWGWQAQILLPCQWKLPQTPCQGMIVFHTAKFLLKNRERPTPSRSTRAVLMKQ